MTPYQRIETVIRYLGEHHTEQPDLAALAAVAGVSEFHFHRLFSRWSGTTPKSFLRFLTLQHARELLSRFAQPARNLAGVRPLGTQPSA